MKKWNMQTEPAVIIGAVGGAIMVLIELLPVFFPAIDSEQIAALLKLTQAVVGVATVLFVRSKVYAPSTVAKIQQGENVG